MKDIQIKNLIKAEEARQKSVINLIASENYVSDDVREALGSVFTNKYAEGYSGARYYNGNVNIDQIEDLAKSRALKVFGLSPKKWDVNVQALSGTPANLAVYLALLPKDGKIMGMELAHGGHLSHGHKVSGTGKWYKQISYTVDKKTEKLDYDEIKKIASNEKPDMIIAGFTAYPRKINWKKFREAADSAKAYLVADVSHIAGLIVAGEHPSPFTYADVVTTTTHKTLRGPRAALIFSRKDERDLPTKIDKAVFPGIQGGPHMNNIAAIAVAMKEAETVSFKKYIKQVVKNATALSDELKKLDWRIISGGTDTHLVLVDTLDQGFSGTDAADRLEKAGIIVNKNTIPFDTKSPFNPSGIRLGSPAETTRGKNEKDFREIARKIDKVLRKQPLGI